ncbi:MAG TPA: hypothetical protein VFA03_01075 [Acetobacteraceae bacterium]|nr:hypothetical protein [Acetobacteraceae bacterium]
MTRRETSLGIAERHVEEAEARVARQRHLVAQLKRDQIKCATAPGRKLL